MKTRTSFLIGICLSFAVYYFAFGSENENQNRNRQASNFIHEQILTGLPPLSKPEFMDDSGRIEEADGMLLLSSYFNTQDKYGQEITVTYSALFQETKNGWNLLILKLDNELVRLGSHRFEK